MLSPTPKPGRRFQLVLIKPSHYDDDGYVIQWVHSLMPANTLAVLYGLGTDAARRRVLGEATAIDVTAMDEANTRVRAEDIISLLSRHGGFGLVGLVGVQSNQFPRALDIARPLRAAGVPVIIGGFHVSGCLALLPDMQADLRRALDMGVSLFAGEAEGKIDEVLRDAADGTLKPIYDHLKDLPALESTPTPMLPRRNTERVIKLFASFDAGRGCPFQCSFCTIINVQGRKSRRRSPDDVERIVRDHWAQGVKRLFITDDNFARNKDWEPIFDRIIALRERENLKVDFIIQVDTLCHKIPNFIEKAARAGVIYAFIGLENISPGNLIAAKKRQNRITEYRDMLLAWKQVGVITAAGYILGFPNDTPESIREDIEIIKKELPLDLLEFFCLTPLPGSEDHKVLWQKNAWMDPDMNKYDVEHVVADHPRMSAQQWAAIYREAWDIFYTRAHMLTVLRRAAAARINLHWVIETLAGFSSMVALEKVHPLQGGVIRRKYRLDRRAGFPIEPAWPFRRKYTVDVILKTARYYGRWASLYALALRVWCNPWRSAYIDQALTPVSDGETETLQLFVHDGSAREAVEHSRKIAALTRVG